MRPIPFIIFLAAMQPLTIVVVGTSIGTVAAIFPMVVMCTFATSRLVEQNLVPVDPGVIEAARSMGAGKLTIIRTVLIPEALAPLILAYAFLFIGVLDMSAMAGYIGGGGLGNFAIAYGYQKFDQTVTWTAVIIMSYWSRWSGHRQRHRQTTAQTPAITRHTDPIDRGPRQYGARAAIYSSRY